MLVKFDKTSKPFRHRRPLTKTRFDQSPSTSRPRRMATYEEPEKAEVEPRTATNAAAVNFMVDSFRCVFWPDSVLIMRPRIHVNTTVKRFAPCRSAGTSVARFNNGSSTVRLFSTGVRLDTIRLYYGQIRKNCNEWSVVDACSEHVRR
jgi:hypothetical protein